MAAKKAQATAHEPHKSTSSNKITSSASQSAKKTLDSKINTAIIGFVGVVLVGGFLWLSVTEKQPVQEGPQLPPEPPGYSYRACADTGAHFLVPGGWSFKEDPSDITRTCYITEGSTGDDNLFETGFKVTISRQNVENSSTTPGDTVRELVAEMAPEGAKDNLAPAEFLEVFESYSINKTTTTKEGEEVGKIILGVANNKTGALYLLEFKTPVETWGDNSGRANVVLDSLVFDQEF